MGGLLFILFQGGLELAMIVALLVAAFLVRRRVPTRLGYSLIILLCCNVVDRILTRVLPLALVIGIPITGGKQLEYLFSAGKVIGLLGVGIFLWALLSSVFHHNLDKEVNCSD